MHSAWLRLLCGKLCFTRGDFLRLSKVIFGSDKSSPGMSGNLSSSIIKNIYYCIFSDEQRRSGHEKKKYVHLHLAQI